jgi:D-alanyl-lipoteichoic acid acyltransferase DltB (MBOAT superfamily)
MLFNSTEFILVFLPITLIGYLWIRASSLRRFQYLWVAAASLFFYAWWNPAYLALLVGSIGLNYVIGRAMYCEARSLLRSCYLWFGIAANLGIIGYYKYSTFLLDIYYNELRQQDVILHDILLPLGISFFTFQQITYLVGAYRHEVEEYSILHYATFVTFFPQLIAGPIVHHSEMLPQFQESHPIARSISRNLAVGMSIFAIGLFKKVMIADRLALIATPVFQSSLDHNDLSFCDAWFGALSYTFQLYFDFSGYSDMAIGLARMFGIILPVNFLSPYKSTSIIEFWRRWHITLSRFLLEYIYIPLGGNRKGTIRRYANLMVTMLLGGLWHGAGWTFVFWGFLHGLWLCINHLWKHLRPAPVRSHPYVRRLQLAGAWLVTFLAVVISWVFFRAETMASAMVVVQAMFDVTNIELPRRLVGPLAEPLSGIGVQLTASGARPFVQNAALIAGSLILCMWGKNVVEIFREHGPVIDISRVEPGSSSWCLWRPKLQWAAAIGTLAFFALCAVVVHQNTEFLYFNF